MKRKVYANSHERRQDQAIGFWVFPVVNYVLWANTTWLWERAREAFSGSPDRDLADLVIALLPWAINGLILALALIFRPQMAVGYIAFIGAAVGGGFILRILVVGACFVSLPFWFFQPSGLIVWLGLILWGLIFLGRMVIRWYNEWLSKP